MFTARIGSSSTGLAIGRASASASLAAAATIGALALGLPVVIAFAHTGLVERLPTAVLSASLVLLAFLSLGCGLVLDALARGRKELKRLAYLAARPVAVQ